MFLIGERVRERRKALGMTQEDLASLLEADQKQISIYESGKGNPTTENLIALARQLQTSTDFLVGLSDDPTPYGDRGDLTSDESEIISALRRGDALKAVKIISTKNTTAQV